MPRYFTYRNLSNAPPANGFRAPQNVGWQAGRGYYAKTPGAAASRPAPQSRLSPIGQIIANYQRFVQTPAQVSSFANKSVDAQVNAAIAENAAANAAALKRYDDQARRAQGFAAALGEITRPDPAAIADQYRRSAGMLNAFGTGLTGTVAEAQQAQTGKIAADVAAATGNRGGEVASYDVNALRNAGQMAGVTIPGSTLAEEAANAFAQGSFARTSQTARVGQIAQDYLSKKADLDAQVEAANQAVRAKRPGWYLDALKEAQAAQGTALSNLISARYLTNTLTKTKADIAADKAKTKAATVPVFDSTNSNALGFRADQNGFPLNGVITPMPGFKLNKAGDGVVEIKTGKSKPGMSVSDRQQLQGDLSLWTTETKPKQQWVTTKNAQGESVGHFVNVPGTGSDPLDYGEVVRNLMDGYGLNRAQAQTYVNKRYKVGQYGRPYPVTPPAGTLPLSETEVVSPSGTRYKLVGRKWILQPSQRPQVGAKQVDANGDVFVWNGTTWEKQ